MELSQRMKKLLEDYPVIQCTICNNLYIHIAVVEREGAILDVIRQGANEFCPYCGSMSPTDPNNQYKDVKKYNRKRLKIKGKDGFPVVKIYKLDW